MKKTLILLAVMVVLLLFANNKRKDLMEQNQLTKKSTLLKNVEKEILLKEIHHRVKNNLGIIISMISLQIRNNPYPEFRKPMKDIELRIRSMALIHEYLYHSDFFNDIPLSDYLHSLSTAIMETLGDANVRLATDLIPMNIPMTTALSLGLITNELITNSIKYAFPDHREGEIHIILKPESNNGEYSRLTIEDNGAGLPNDFSIERQAYTGLFIVKLLIEQLGAKLDIENEKGASFHIIFQNLNA